MHIVAQFVVRAGDRRYALVEAAASIERIQFDFDTFIYLNPKHIFALLRPVLDHVLFGVGEVLPRNREREREVSLVEQNIFSQLGGELASGG